MKQQKGFTLIELIIVIVILGILAVTAAPRFFDFSGDARASSITGLQGAVQGASQVEYASSAIDGTPAYPSESEIIDAAQLNSLEFNTPGSSEWVHEIDDTITITTITLSSLLEPGTGSAGDVANTACFLTYDATGIGADTPPSISVDVSGC